MDKDILNRYDSIANKVEEISEKTWDGLVLQLKIESIATVMFCLLLVIISSIIIGLFIRQYRLAHNSNNYEVKDEGYINKLEFKKKPIIFDNPERSDFDLNSIGLTWMCISICGLVVIICSVTQLFISVPKLIYPEPYVIKDLIESIGGK
jgi:hypothetical protein